MPYRVLIVDDSAFIRHALKRILGGESDFEVIASAADGRQALSALDEHAVDVVVLDVEMPVMDGLTTLEEIRKRDRSLPIVMFSTLTTRGSAATMDALTRGASGYVSKPSNQGSQEEAFESVRSELVPMLRSLAETHAIRRRRVAAPVNVTIDSTRRAVTASAPSPAAPTPATSPPTTIASPDDLPRPRTRTLNNPIDVVAIGVSTGGPAALHTVLSALPGDLGIPVVITQHMPPVFTGLLASRLDGVSPLTVSEAQEGDLLRPDHVYLAPGDRHMRFAKAAGGIRVVLDDGPLLHSCRPAVDVMLESLATLTADRTLVAILTGMGRDGLEGSRRLADLGAPVIAQDAESSVVWGMPGFVAREGVAHAVLPLDEIATEITRIARSSDRAQGHPA